MELLWQKKILENMFTRITSGFEPEHYQNNITTLEERRNIHIEPKSQREK